MTNGISKYTAWFDHYNPDPKANYQHCWNDALYNLLTHPVHAYEAGEDPHRLAAGTLRNTNTGIPIYGSKHNNPQDFFDSPQDAHCWIEDADGRIWDYIPPQHNQSRGIKIPPEGIHIMGMTPAEIKRKYRLGYERTSNNAIAKVYDLAFAGFMPFFPRRDDNGKYDAAPGYYNFTMSKAELTIMGNYLTQSDFEQWDEWRMETMNFNGLINGCARTLLQWQQFYKTPLDFTRFAPMINILEEKTYTEYTTPKICRLKLADNYETIHFITEGIAYGELAKGIDIALEYLRAH